MVRFWVDGRMKFNVYLVRKRNAHRNNNSLTATGRSAVQPVPHVLACSGQNGARKCGRDNKEPGLGLGTTLDKEHHASRAQGNNRGNENQ